MKTYKEFEREYIGSSDIATLIMVGISNGKLELKPLEYGIDSSYFAYMVEGEADIGLHYELVAEFSNWLKIYDDEGLTVKLKGKKIRVYRAGEMGCIIQVL